MNSDNNNLIIEDSALADIFTVKYASDLSRDALLLYIWMNMCFKGKTFTRDDVLKLNLSGMADCDKTLAELAEAELITPKGDRFVMDDLKRREVEEYVAFKNAAGTNPEGTAMTKGGEKFDLLASSISKTFYQGRMPYIYYRFIDTCLNEYKFGDEVVYKLFEYAKDNMFEKKFAQMERVAKEWFNNGYTTCERLEAHLKKDSDVAELTKLMGKLMRRRMNNNDIERIEKWVRVMDVDKDLVNYAFKVNEFRGDIKMADVENTLLTWQEAGVKTVDAAVVFEDERYKENKRKSSRKKGRSGSSWKTGGEAGIAEQIAPAKKEDDDDGDSGDIPDDILDMFGGGDEDN